MTALAAFAVALIAAFGMAFAAMALWARRHPLEAFVRLTRRSLLRAGLVKRELKVKGDRIVYFTGGRASRTMVLVHGVNDQAGSWSAVVPALAQRFRVVAVDLRGHGESDPRSGPLPMQPLVEGLAAVIDRVSPDEPVILVGNSMGGWVSILYALAYPQRVSHLVLEDASGMTWDIRGLPLFPKDRDEALRLLRLVHGPKAPIPEFLVDGMIRLAPSLPQARVLAADMEKWFVDDRLGELGMPVTLIWGAHDGLLPLDYAKKLQSAIPGAKLHVIETAAHAPHRQPRGEFTKILLEATA